MNNPALILALLIAATSLLARADTADSTIVRPAMMMFSAEVGHTSLLDTYLTPITYGGVSSRLAFEHNQAFGRRPSTWTRQLTLGLTYDRTRNPARNNTIHALMLDARWSAARRWQLPTRVGAFQLQLGPQIALRGGAYYDPANSNNVANAKIHLSAGLQAAASLPIRLGRVPIVLRYQASLPVIGAFFSPEYDQSYYEIQLGNRERIVRPAWWGTRFDLDHTLSADLQLGATLLRLGYRNLIERSHVSHITTRVTTHAFVIGLGGEWMSLSGRKINPNTKIISARY